MQPALDASAHVRPGAALALDPRVERTLASTRWRRHGGGSTSSGTGRQALIRSLRPPMLTSTGEPASWPMNSPNCHCRVSSHAGVVDARGETRGDLVAARQRLQPEGVVRTVLRLPGRTGRCTCRTISPPPGCSRGRKRASPPGRRDRPGRRAAGRRAAAGRRGRRRAAWPARGCRARTRASVSAVQPRSGSGGTASSTACGAFASGRSKWKRDAGELGLDRHRAAPCLVSSRASEPGSTSAHSSVTKPANAPVGTPAGACRTQCSRALGRSGRAKVPAIQAPPPRVLGGGQRRDCAPLRASAKATRSCQVRTAGRTVPCCRSQSATSTRGPRLPSRRQGGAAQQRSRHGQRRRRPGRCTASVTRAQPVRGGRRRDRPRRVSRSGCAASPRLRAQGGVLEPATKAVQPGAQRLEVGACLGAHAISRAAAPGCRPAPTRTDGATRCRAAPSPRRGTDVAVAREPGHAARSSRRTRRSSLTSTSPSALNPRSPRRDVERPAASPSRRPCRRDGHWPAGPSRWRHPGLEAQGRAR